MAPRPSRISPRGGLSFSVMGLRGLRRSPRANGDLGRAEEFLCESRSPQARDQLAEWPVPSVAPEQVEELPARDAIPPQTQTRSACALQLSSRVGLCTAVSTYNRIPRRSRVRRRTPKWRAPGGAVGSVRRLLARFSRLVFYGPWSVHFGQTRSMTAHIGGSKAESVNPNLRLSY